MTNNDLELVLSCSGQLENSLWQAFTEFICFTITGLYLTS